ncbi:MAG: ABC transporter substrate-binding protein [Clostridiales bacterium]|nr:ABC transporter substrate-binding protein [Clostridiales bacterium]
MKKFISLLIAAVMTVGVFTGCSSQSSETTEAEETVSAEEEVVDDVTINAIMLKGPTGIGAVELMEKSANGEAAGNYSFEISSASDEVTAKILNGEADIAAVPTNLAAVLYNKTEGGVSVIALNTLGVLYVLENGESINSISDLQGKTIYSSGQGAIPEYAFNYILEQNNVTDTNIVYVTEHAEAAAALADGSADVAVLPEPNVTAVMMQNEYIRIALDLTEEWSKVSDTDLAMGCVIVRNEFLKEHPAAVANFLAEYSESIEYVNSNISEAASLVEKYEIMASAAAAEKAIPNCNIVYIDGAEMKDILEGLYEVLYAAEPKSVGGTLPSAEFYYEAE